MQINLIKSKNMKINEKIVELNMTNNGNFLFEIWRKNRKKTGVLLPYGEIWTNHYLRSLMFLFVVSTKPTITYCLVTARNSTHSVQVSCASATNPVVYTNIRPTWFSVCISFYITFNRLYVPRMSGVFMIVICTSHVWSVHDRHMYLACLECS